QEAGWLNNGTLIPADSTKSPVDFDQFLQSFDQPTRQALSGVVQEAGTAVDGRGQDINTLLGDLHDLSVDSTPDLETFSDRSQNLDRILKNLDDVGGNLSDQRNHLAGVYTNLDGVLGTLAQNDAGFRRFIEQGNVGLGHGITQFSGEEQNFNSIIRELHPALDQLNPTLTAL